MVKTHANYSCLQSKGKQCCSPVWTPSHRPNQLQKSAPLVRTPNRTPTEQHCATPSHHYFYIIKWSQNDGRCRTSAECPIRRTPTEHIWCFVTHDCAYAEASTTNGTAKHPSATDFDSVRKVCIPSAPSQSGGRETRTQSGRRETQSA